MDTFAADLSRLPNPTTHRTPPPLRGATAPSLRRQPGPNPGPTSDGPHDLPSPAGCGAPVSTHKTDCEPSISRIEDVHCPLSMFFRPCLFFSGHIRRRLIAVLDRNPTAPSRTTTQTPGTSTELRQIYGPHPRLQPCSRVANGRPATVANRPPARRGAARRAGSGRSRTVGAQPSRAQLNHRRRLSLARRGGDGKPRKAASTATSSLASTIPRSSSFFFFVFQIQVSPSCCAV